MLLSFKVSLTNIIPMLLDNKPTGVHDRLNPPFRPPRPNRTLGGTNLRALNVDERPSMSISGVVCEGGEDSRGRVDNDSSTRDMDGVAVSSWFPLGSCLGISGDLCAPPDC